MPDFEPPNNYNFFRVFDIIDASNQVTDGSSYLWAYESVRGCLWLVAVDQNVDATVSIRITNNAARALAHELMRLAIAEEHRVPGFTRPQEVQNE